MGKKKSKEKEKPSNDTVSAPPQQNDDVFSSLFGNDPTDVAVSLFSENNPFKRKPQNDDVVVAPTEHLKTPKKPIQQQKRPSTVVVVHEAPIDSDNKEENNANVEKVTKKKKNKRKRDEIELDYEAKKYGAGLEKEKEEAKVSAAVVVVGEKRKKLDDPGDTMVSKEGFDDETKLLRTVFVGNLPLNLKKKKLVKEFAQFGEVESVRIRSVPLAADTKKPRKGAVMLKQINDTVGSVNAYVVFKTEQAAQASLAHNMAMVGGNHIRVDRACPPRKKLKGESVSLYDSRRTIFVGNLPFDVKDEELYQLFCGLGGLESSVEAVRVVRDPKINVGKGIAYVLFKTREAASMAVKKRNLKLRDRELRLCHAKADATPAKRKNPSADKAIKSPSKRLAVEPKTPESNKRVNAKNSLSYQGMRASKSGSSKKSNTKITRGLVKGQKGEKSKEQKGKRPAVAARKAKQLAAKEGGASQNVGKKRKMENRTPQSSKRNKKFKKLR